MRPLKLSETFKTLESCRLYENSGESAKRQQISVQGVMYTILTMMPVPFSIQSCLARLVRTGAASGCEFESSGTAGKTATQEQALTEENQSRLIEAQPPTKLSWSLERENINKRTNLWNAPNKVSYIYLVNYGKIMAFYTVKGKVSSVNSQITNPEQIVSGYSSSNKIPSTVAVTIPSPAEDGSYGTNGDAIFFFTTDGVYVEWAGDYMLADQALQLTTQPELVRNIK